MAPSRAVRLFTQHLQVVIRDQKVQASTLRPGFLQTQRWNRGIPSASICLRCSIQASSRFYSTGGKPPFEAARAAEEAAKSPAPKSAKSLPADQPSQPEPEYGSQAAPSPELPSTSEAKRSVASARFGSTFLDNLQSRVLVASQTLNDLTGYSAIEAIKLKNNKLEDALSAAQSRPQAARRSYKTLNSNRASTQREVTTLLARKDTWSPIDLERFTTLYRSDHELEAQVTSRGRGADGGGGGGEQAERGIERGDPAAVPRGADLVGSDPAPEYLGHLGPDGGQLPVVPGAAVCRRAVEARTADPWGRGRGEGRLGGGQERAPRGEGGPRRPKEIRPGRSPGRLG